MIWFDLDNSPHVVIFRPIFEELKKRGVGYVITARDYAQTKDLLELWCIPYSMVGEYGGKNKFKKIYNLIHRSLKLRKFIKNKGVKLAVSHGSRTQAVASRLSGIKSILMLDYEFTETSIFNFFSDYILMPAVIPESRLEKAGFKMKKVIRYNGLKEEIYLNGFIPEKGLRKNIGVKEDEILVVIRPPSMTSNYHDKNSEILLLKAIDHFLKNAKSVILVISRTLTDKEFILSQYKGNSRIRFLDKPVDGLQLLNSADITLSGGGTMNRESALLGTKTYSYFSGRRPYVDEYLNGRNMINFIESSEDIEKIEIVKKNSNNINSSIINNLIGEVTDVILEKYNINNKKQ